MKKSQLLATAVCALVAASLLGCAGPQQDPIAAASASPPARLASGRLGCATAPPPAGVQAQQAPAAPGNGPVTVFRSVSLLAMTGAPIQHDMTVIVRGGTIERAGRGLRIPAGATVIDGRGKWLMPGLVDAHMHLTNLRDIDVPVLQVALANGVTSEFDMGGSGLPKPTERVRIREDIEAGRLVAPTIYVGAPSVDDSKLTLAGGIALVDAARADGFDFIKVYNQLSKDGYRGILLRAAQIGMPIVGHVVREIGMEGTLGSGQRGIVHMEEYLYTYFPFRSSETETDPTQLLNPAAIPYLAQRTLQAGVWVTPTLVFQQRMIEQSENLDEVLAREQSKFIPVRYYSGNWIREKNRRAREFAVPERMRNLRAAYAYQKLMTRAFAEAGVPLLVGTDSPVATVAPGFDVHQEMVNFVGAGVSTEQTLAAATCAAALYLGHNDFGSIAPGKRADLLLLTANPVADIRNTRAIAGVMARGRWLDRAALAALLERSRRADPPAPAAPASPPAASR